MNARKFLNDLPIKRKLLLVTLVTCAAALALACTALFWFQSVQFRKGFAAELESLSSIIAHNSSAPLAFDDKKSAVEVLSALKVKPHITYARVLDAKGQIFAQYGRADSVTEAGGIAPGPVVIFKNGYATLSLPIKLEDSKPGQLQLCARFQDQYRELVGLYTVVLSGVVASSLLIILLLSSVLQRIIAGPIIQLAEVAGAITENEDYSTRASAGGRDEVGLLTRAFNRMLDQIEARDVALNLSQRKLEALIHSIDGAVWEWSPLDETFSFISRQCESMLGYPPEAWLGDPKFWDRIVHPDDLVLATQACADATARKKPYSYEYRMIAADQRVVWVRESGVVRVENGRATAFLGLFLDITEQKHAAKELARLNQELIGTSRQAGMAEVATGVLHNVGNVLNSVGVSATLVADRLRQSKVAGLCRATTLLRGKNGQLAEYLTTDPKGKLLPEYLGVVADQLAAEQAQMIEEMNSVGQHVEHIKEIVAMQQSYAKVSGAFENLSAADLVEDALKLNVAAIDRHGVQLVREINRSAPMVCVDRHKVLQILINLIRNAKHAMDARESNDKQMIVRVEATSPDWVRIIVRDNGIGIAPELLVKIFNHGFTTKKDGHGFGLHSGANAAREMGGNLTVASEGAGHGATFILELPVATNAPSTVAR